MADRATLSPPAVRIPPPLLFAAGWLGAWALHAWVPFVLDVAGASPLQRALGLVLVAVGASTAFWAVRTFARFGTPVLPWRPARVLVTHGPFRFSRNPIYLGLGLVYAGLAVTFNLAWPFILLPVVLMVVRPLAIDPEERHLRASFGAEYERYCRRVPRWL